MNDETLLALLFSQLTWPSVLVRERTCVAIARLLSDPKSAVYTGEYLLRWLKTQELESVAILGLLALFRARIEGMSELISAQAVAASLSKPSILSTLILQEYAPDAPSLTMMTPHSGTAPSNFVAETFFTEHVKSYLAPIFDLWADGIERRERIPFRRQWVFEWSLLRERVGIELSIKPIQFWLSGSSYKERYQGADMPLSEIYRSAYLRALGWSLETSRLTRENAIFLAAQSCPIDLELWRLQPKRKPSWWPQADEPEGQVDTAAIAIWSAVGDLWQAYVADDPPWGREWVLAEASGLVHRGATTYELEIFGIYQKCIGPEPPDFEELAEWYRGDGYDGNRVNVRTYSPLRLQGEAEGVLPDERSWQSGDWSLVPAAGPVEIMSTIPRWQWWRMMRKIWMTTHHLGGARLEFGFSADSIQTRKNGQVVACWNDWTEALGETLLGNMPPETGQLLLVKRDLVGEFTAATGSTFCWVCRLTGYHQKRTGDDLEQFSDFRSFGASIIVMP